jgi:hypothetical protein
LLQAIVKCHARLYDLRVKDRSSAKVKAPNVEAGRGLIDLAAVFRALLKINHLKFIA